MSSQSSRATYVRKWRVGRRQKRRFDALASDYVNTKYPAIREECYQFYTSLNKKYPHKHDLTKTKEYRKWKSGISKGQTSDEDSETGSTETAETITKIRGYEERKNETPEHETSDEDGPVETSDEDGPVETAEQDTGEIVEEPTTEPIQDILRIAAEDLIPLSPQNPNDLDNIINDIINDLQQDDELQRILDDDGDYVQPHYMDEDEGIGLNVESELEAIIEPLDLEEEGVFF